MEMARGSVLRANHMLIACKSHANHMQITMGSLWDPNGLYGALWGPYGALWGPYWALWGPIGHYGALWSSMIPYGSLWGSMGSLWGFMGLYKIPMGC